MTSELAPHLTATTPEKRGLRERQRQARGEAILQAALTLIVEEGYEALTMEGLAERVGISRQTLYHHFASKEEITLSAILTLMEQGLRTIEAIDPNLTPLERLTRVVRWLLESRFQPTTAAFVRVRHSLMPVKAHPDYKRAFEQRAAALARLVKAAQDSGELRTDLPAPVIVQMLLGLVSDASYEGLVAAGTVSPSDIANTVIDVLFKGLRP